jgi:dihydrodipicolinate synthase/N-acetylneuraminate lyase
VTEVVRRPTEAGARRLGEIRDRVQRFPFHAALKHLLICRGVSINEHCRKPLRGLMPDEKAELDRIADELLSVITR